MNQKSAEETLQNAISSAADATEIESLKRECKRAARMVDIMMWLGIASVIVLLLYGIGCVWYYFCGGFLVFEDQPFWDKIICGLISLVPFGLLIGFIMICFGWDPDKR